MFNALYALHGALYVELSSPLVSCDVRIGKVFYLWWYRRISRDDYRSALDYLVMSHAPTR